MAEPTLNVQKTLEGKIRLEKVPGYNTIYNFVVPTVRLSGVTQKLSDKVLEEVYIICDTTNGQISINLPKISNFQNFWNTKIYITCTSGEDKVNIYPYTEEVAVDTLNGNESIGLGLYDAYYFHIIENNTWIALKSPSLL